MKKNKEIKQRALFSIDPGVLEEFKFHCKKHNINMSNFIQEKMHELNVKYAGDK